MKKTLACAVVAFVFGACGGHDEATVDGANGALDAPRDSTSSGGARRCTGSDPPPEASVDEEHNGCFDAPLAFARSRLCYNDEIVVCDTEPQQIGCNLECVPGTGWMPAMAYELISGTAVRDSGGEPSTLAFILRINVANHGETTRAVLTQFLSYSANEVEIADVEPTTEDEVTVEANADVEVDFHFRANVAAGSPLESLPSVDIALRQRPASEASFGTPVTVPISD